jgi:hypothetical protein
VSGIQRLVWSLVVVKLEIVGKMYPQPFDEVVVVDPASSIQTYFDPRVF